MKTYFYFLRCLAVLLMAVILLAGCSLTRPYADTPQKNLTIWTTTDSGFLSSVRASVDIYEVDDTCQTEYLGTVKLHKPQVEVGIPVDKTSYLVFVFGSSSFLANSSGTTNYDTLLKPQAGYDYYIDVSYKDDIYNVVMREMPPDKTAGHDVEPMDLNTCNAL